MAVSTGRLSAAPDGYSDVVAADKTIGTAPVVVRMRQTSGTGAGPTTTTTKCRQCRHTLEEGADMVQRTRTTGLPDSETRTSAVKITPVSSDSATVPTTHASA